jgi:hypothetical protein
MNNKILKILVSCEESQVVTKAFRELGHEAYSNDIIPTSGNNPEWHLKMDCFEAIKLKEWDLLIAHPTCTYLTVTANKWLKDQPERKSGALVGEKRRKAQQEAIDFFMRLYNSDIKHIAIENPIGVMSTKFRKPDQIIQPFQFGDPERKSTCLWLKNLPLLVPTNMVEPILYTYKDGRTDGLWHVKTMKLSMEERSKERSKTFPGIAKALAQQYSEYLLK